MQNPYDKTQKQQITVHPAGFEWLSLLKNTNAQAIEEADYQDAAKSCEIECAAIKAVFAVESAKSGYNNDGSVKSLLERHLVRREVIAAGLPLSDIAKKLGGELLNWHRGGYRGGVAEYWRIRTVIMGIGDGGLDIALRSASWGRPQILGRNCELAGYSTAAEMVEAFHRDEKSQLQAFVKFCQNTGLDKHLRNKDWLSFAKGYNGKNCCDKGSKRNYAALIAAEYRRLEDSPVEFGALQKSRVVQGSILSKAGTIGAGIGVFELQGYLDQISSLKNQASETLAQVGDIKNQATELISQNSGLIDKISGMETWLYFIGAVLIISLSANLYTLYARWDDRRHGYK